MLYTPIFKSLHEAMDKIENNAEKSDTDKSLDHARIEKLKELFQDQSLLDELGVLIDKKLEHMNGLAEAWDNRIIGAEDKLNKAKKARSELIKYRKLVMPDELISTKHVPGADADGATHVRPPSPTTRGGRKLRTKKRKVHKKKSKVHKKKSKKL
tara:strand:+ start:154 stop:618 length:465 start_codon:yes stop_codon:yes gene_type:complete